MPWAWDASQVDNCILSASCLPQSGKITDIALDRANIVARWYPIEYSNIAGARELRTHISPELSVATRYEHFVHHQNSDILVPGSNRAKLPQRYRE